MFDRPDSGERAVLVHLTFHSGQEDLLELKELAKSAGTDPVLLSLAVANAPIQNILSAKASLMSLKRR